MLETLVSFEQIEQEKVEEKRGSIIKKINWMPHEKNEKLPIKAAQTIFKIQ